MKVREKLEGTSEAQASLSPLDLGAFMWNQLLEVIQWEPEAVTTQAYLRPECRFCLAHHHLFCLLSDL